MPCLCAWHLNISLSEKNVLLSLWIGCQPLSSSRLYLCWLVAGVVSMFDGKVTADVVFFENRNGFLANKAYSLWPDFSEKIFSSPFIAEHLALTVDFPFLWSTHCYRWVQSSGKIKVKRIAPTPTKSSQCVNAPPGGVNWNTGYWTKKLNECSLNYDLDNSVPIFKSPEGRMWPGGRSLPMPVLNIWNMLPAVQQWIKGYLMSSSHVQIDAWSRSGTDLAVLVI